jgi:hypothetical protein
MGERGEQEVIAKFGDLDPNVYDMYAGVHVSAHPVVATAYALGNRDIGEGDWGFDVVNPGVLLGLKTSKKSEIIDADGYTVASNFLTISQQLYDDDHHFDEFDLGDLILGPESEDSDESDIQDTFRDYARSDLTFDDSLGIGYIGGDAGNRAGLEEYVVAVAELLPMWHALVDEDEIKLAALRLAKKFVPQGRILRDIPPRSIACVVVLPPWRPASYTDGWEEAQGAGWVDLSSPEWTDELYDYSSPEEYDAFVLRNSTVVYGDPNKAKTWHGTSLSRAAEALPSIFTPAVKQAAFEAGSAYDAEDYDDFDEDED